MNTHSGITKASAFPTDLLPLPERADLSDPQVRGTKARPMTATQEWATVLAAARHRRAPHMWPPPGQQTLREEPVIGGALVRAYVLSEDERARTLARPARKNQ